MNKRERLKDKIVDLLRARWVVDDDGDPGIALGRGPFRVIIGYYKWADTFTFRRAALVDHREASKRELSQVVREARTHGYP